MSHFNSCHHVAPHSLLYLLSWIVAVAVRFVSILVAHLFSIFPHSPLPVMMVVVVVKTSVLFRHSDALLYLPLVLEQCARHSDALLYLLLVLEQHVI